MNLYLAWGIIIFLLIIIGVLSVAVLIIIKKATYLSQKDKDFIIFAIDMYIDYAVELDIHSEYQHELIVKQLKRIKEKYLK
jgi:hypothetical protein